MRIVNYEISFKTIQKYCKHKRDNWEPAKYKYRCRKLEISLLNGADEFPARCTQKNCPLVKRLWT
jgi:hypothetical protein